MAASMDEIRAASTVAIIDGNSLMHRAFHAVPEMNAPDGRATNACFGFLSMLLKLIDDFKPNAIVCAFDAGRPAFRMEALQQYKAQRPPMDPALKEQFPMMEELLEAMNIPVVREKGWEGDDILGTLSTWTEHEGNRYALLITGDKDAFQLADKHVSIVTTKKGISDVVVYDPQAVLDRYGVMPSQVPDFLGLKGDSSDNIPGVPGIGEKTAARLLQQYGNLEGLYAHKDELKGKMAQNVADNEEAAYNSRLVATIRRDVPIDLDLDSVHFPSFDPLKVREAFGKLRFNNHLERVLAFEDGAAATTDAGASDAPEQTSLLGSAGSGSMAVNAPVLIGADAQTLLDSAVASGAWVSVWAEETAGLSLFDSGGVMHVGTEQGVACFNGADMLPTLLRLMESAPLVVLDAKRVMHLVYPNDTSEEALATLAQLCDARFFDASVAAYLLDSGRKDFSLGTLVADFLKRELPVDSKTSEPVAADAAACLLALRPVLAEALEKDGSLRCFDEMEMPLIPVLADMERTGVDLDVDVLREMGKSTEQTVDGLRTQIYRAAGEEFNIDSPKQLGVILFEKLKLPAKKKTRTGYSTDAKVLTELAEMHPLPQLVLEYRELAKMRSTYIEALPRLLGGDARLHTTFNQTVTATGRLSSSDPNLQNIPVRTEFGRRIRAAFVPKGENMVFLAADYSQIELRLLAHLSGDPGLIAAFTSGADFHASTAARVFGVPVEQVDAGMRSRAKAVNFGIVYGQQAYGLSQSLHCSFREAQAMIDRYFEAYPQVREYLDNTVEQARQDGYVTTMFGRKRHIPEIISHNQNLRAFGERTAMNHPMQGSAADIIKLAMIQTSRKLQESNIRARFCLQVHDELDFEVPESQADELGNMVRNIMEHVVELSVPLNVGVSVGHSWADAK